MAGSFRVNYYDLGATGNQRPSMEIIAYDREGSPTVDATQLGEESGETIVDEPPGTYYLDLVTIGEVDYK